MQTGGTPYFGLWQLIATITVNVGGSETTISDTSTVIVRRNGSVDIEATDSSCSLNIGVNGDVLTYRTSCIFPVSLENVSTTCTLTFESRGVIRGSPNAGRLSSSFGPETKPCRGVAAAYTGNLLGTQRIPDNDNGAQDGTNNGSGDGNAV